MTPQTKKPPKPSLVGLPQPVLNYIMELEAQMDTLAKRDPLAVATAKADALMQKSATPLSRGDALAAVFKAEPALYDAVRKSQPVPHVGAVIAPSPPRDDPRVTRIVRAMFKRAVAEARAARQAGTRSDLAGR